LFPLHVHRVHLPPGASPHRASPSPLESPARLFSLEPEGVNVPDQSGLSDNSAGGLAYVTFIPAIIFLIVEPFNKNPYVRFHSWQSIFLAIAWFAVNIVLVAIGHVPIVGMIDLFLWPVLGLGFFALWLVVMIQAFSGKRFKIPIIGDLAEKQANS
jgi:uncharacterized membrane protein